MRHAERRRPLRFGVAAVPTYLDEQDPPLLALHPLQGGDSEIGRSGEGIGQGTRSIAFRCVTYTALDLGTITPELVLGPPLWIGDQRRKCLMCCQADGFGALFTQA